MRRLYRSLLSAGCGLAAFAPALLPVSTHAQERDTEELLRYAKAVYPGELCDWLWVDQDPSSITAHTLTYRYAHEDETDPVRQAALYEVPCWQGAYNVGTAWFIEKEYDGLLPLRFAEPDLDIAYADDMQETVEDISVTGFSTASTLVNASFDEQAQTIVTANRWRGLADASSSGTWTFRHGAFVLTRFEVDASYDGEMNSATVFEADTR